MLSREPSSVRTPRSPTNRMKSGSFQMRYMNSASSGVSRRITRRSVSNTGSGDCVGLFIVTATVFDPARFVAAGGVVMRPVHDTALGIPLVLTPKAERGSHLDIRNPRRQRDVVRDQDGQPRRQSHDEALMRRSFAIILEHPVDDAPRRHHDSAGFIAEQVVDDARRNRRFPSAACLISEIRESTPLLAPGMDQEAGEREHRDDVEQSTHANAPDSDRARTSWWRASWQPGPRFR